MKLVYFLVLYCSCISVNAHPPWVCNETELAASGGPTEDHITYPTIIFGVSTKANVSDPIIKNISAFALPTIDSRLDGTFKIARIVSAEFRSAAGTLYYLQLEVCTTNSNRGEDDASSECIQTGEANKHLCDVLVWDRPWQPEREVTALDCTAINARRKRELAVNAGHTESNTTTHILGGLTKANVSDPIIKNISAFALPTIDNRLDGTFKIARIVSAETQVVEGTLYYLRLEVCTTNSNRGEDDASSECIQTGEANKYLCDVQVWDRPWLPEREVSELNCTAINARRKRELAVNAGHTEGNTTYPTVITGGRTKANVSDPIIKNISAFALPVIDNRLDGTFKIARIISAETQVVEGVIYYIRLEVCSTNSNSGEDDASSDCIITGESNQQVCDVQVWDRPWLPKREVTQLNCIPINSSRKKRGILLKSHQFPS
ncbi:uncharacterized protein LOC126188844 isoform X2 [Schistocerca cancellata]|uniref:uncharacterized protein LOC126188844 isoform X2 n=1 Tax=Schistocerca cancellata TaxID=274614 RepID=UPI0021193E27|nr:uncharacterized protein LOC126188844 isoform X2 [Schistocerca cancellata]